MGGLCVFVAGAGIYGVFHNDFSSLRDAWAVAGPFAGVLVGYYFHRGKENSG